MKKMTALFLLLAVLLLAVSALAADEPAKCAHKHLICIKTVDSSCSTQGSKTYVCDDCKNYTYVKTLPLAEHDWDCVYVKESTCTTHGYKEYECENCGKERTKTLDLAPHSYGSWQTTKEPTCTEKGARIRYCRRCGHHSTGTIAMLPHPFGSWAVVREATDRSMGTEARVCTACGLRETRDFYPTGTLYPDMPENGAVMNLQQYLTDNGYLDSRIDGDFGKKTRLAVEAYQRAMGFEVTGIAYPQTLTAIFCTETGKDGQSVMTNNVHVYGDWSIVTEATASAPGLRAHTCLYCDYTCEGTYNPAGTLTPGMEKNEEVKALQQLLIDKKIIKTRADGDYGPKTELGVLTFQQMAGLEPTGIAYPETIEALRNWQ